MIIDGMPNMQVTSSATDLITFLRHYYLNAFGIKLQILDCTEEAEEAMRRLHDIIELYYLGDITQCITYAKAYMKEISRAITHCKSGAPGLFKGFDELKKLESVGHASSATTAAIMRVIIPVTTFNVKGPAR